MFMRRDVLKGTTVLGATALTTACVPIRKVLPSQAASSEIDMEAPPRLSGRMLVNKERAYDVMAQEGVDGLIAASDSNVYYLSNTVPILTKMGRRLTSFATFPNSPDEPSFLVTTSAQTWDLANGDREVPEIIGYVPAANWQDYLEAEQLAMEPEAMKFGYAVKDGVPLTTREQGWADAQAKNQSNPVATPIWALAKALKQSGLDRGRVAVDDMRVAAMLTAIGMTNIEFVPGSNIFRKIRIIKSDTELEIMRVGAENNAQAALAAIRALEEGMTYPEFEDRFRAEAAARGNNFVFVLAGVTLGLLPNGEIKRGEPILVDAVSHFHGYMGDFARTVVVGDPPPDVVERSKANQIGRNAAFDMVKAGVRYSEIRAVAKDAMIKAGMPEYAIIVVPHSVGLQHTDEPSRDGYPFGLKDDLILEENMTITIDLPYIEVGWGAGHNEDLIRITKTGYEVLNTEEEPLVIV